MIYLLSLVRFGTDALKSSQEHAMGSVFEPVLNVEREAVPVPLSTSIPIAGQEFGNRKHYERPGSTMLFMLGTVICTSCTMQG